MASANPSDGVTNAWGQAHEVGNLFVSDGSGLSTPGAANPTLTIVALALRQADYIEQQMKARRV
jgi:choline dehydrogenase-like flavoprotein